LRRGKEHGLAAKPTSLKNSPLPPHSSKLVRVVLFSSPAVPLVEPSGEFQIEHAV
jgi:hypothetical protein